MVGELVRITIARRNTKNKVVISQRNINSKNLKKYGIYKKNKETGEVILAKKIKYQTKTGKIVNKAKPVNSKNLFRMPEGYYVNYEPKKPVSIKVKRYDATGNIRTDTIVETQERIKIGYRRRGKTYARNNKSFQSPNLKKYGIYKKNKETGEIVLAKKIKYQTKTGKIVSKAKPVNSKNLFRTPEGYYVKYEPKKLVSIKVKRYDATGNIRTDTIVETQERIKIGYRRRGKTYVRNNKSFQSPDKEGMDVARGIPLPTRFLTGTITFTFPNGVVEKVNTRSKSQLRNTSYTKEDMVGQAINFAVAQLLNSNIISELINAGVKVGSDELKQYVTDIDLNLVKWI